MKRITSLHLTYALMSYFRYNRGWMCADEVSTGGFIADVLVDTEICTIEVEIKTSKSDLIQGEKKKRTGWKNKGIRKHEEWKQGRCGKFALCVPEELMVVAEEWIDKTNEKYGLFIYSHKRDWDKRIWVKRKAKLLHRKYGNVDYKSRILKRLSSCRTQELFKKICEYNKRKKKCK